MYKKILLLLIFGTISYSQTIDFSNALELTLQNNKQIKNSELDIKLSTLDNKEVQGLSLGVLEFSHEASRTNHPGYVFNSKLSSREASFDDFGALEYTGASAINVIPDNLNNPDARNNFTSKISYNIPLFTGFKLSTQEDVLKLKNKANKLKLSLNKKQLSFEVLKAYNSAVVAKEFINAVKKTKEAISYVVKSAQQFHKEGLVTKIDVKQAKVYDLNTNSKLIEAQNNFDIAIAYLRFLTSNENISDVYTLEKIYCDINSINDLHDKALENREEIKMQEINKNAMKKNVDLANSEYYPNIYSHIEYGFNDNKIDLDGTKDYYMAMIGIKYNIFDVTRTTKSQKANLVYKKSINSYEELQNQVKLEIKKSLSNLKAKEKALKEKIKAKELAQEVYEQSKLMYKNQLISMTNLLEQEANLRTNEAQLIISKYNHSLALAKMALAIGVDFTKYKGDN